MEIQTTYAAVVDVLQRASSQNPEILKPAEEKLKEWEIQPGFYNVLLAIISNHELAVNVRWLAVLYMKIGIDRYWRKTAPNAIAEPEKNLIREVLISSFNEPIYQIAVQRAVLISKIARFDYPKDWSQLFPMLLQAVESSDSMTQHRSLLTLHHVIKAISSKRLSVDKRIFHEFTLTVYNYILNMWNKSTDDFVNDIMQNEDINVIQVKLEKALFSLRIMRKLTVYGFYKPNEHGDCVNFLKVIFDKAKIVLQCRKQLTGKGITVLELCEKFIVHLIKVLLSVLDIHPFSFVNFIQPSLEFAFYYLFTDEGINFVFERFVILCFNLIKNILLSAEYRAANIPEMTKHAETLRAHQIKQQIFQPQVICDICRKLVVHYFILTKEELQTWDTDPEMFVNDETGDSWKYCLRPCMETVFVTIFRQYRDQLTPVILELIRETSGLVPPDDMAGILKKDAVYNAVCLCAFDLYDEVDFDQWFTNTLLQELKIKHNNYRIIRRRVTALIGRWAGIKLSTELRPNLYESVIALLSPDEDLAVRLTAATTLRAAIDDFEFNSEQFKDYLFSAFNLLFNLLKEANECETKMQVLNVMTLLLERMGSTIIPHSEALIHYLPHMWQESEDHNMLRCSIVAALVQVVKAMGSVKAELALFLLPIVQLGTDTQQSAIVYLLEDALDLWQVVLEYSTVMSKELMDLFNNMPPLLEYSTENFKTCLVICLVHVLLAPELVLRTQGSQIVNVCADLMGDLKNEGIVILMRLIETCIRACPQLGTETVMPILPKIFNKIYEGTEYPMVMSMYLSILSRILLYSHEIFTRIVTNLSEHYHATVQATLSKILDVWLNKMQNVTQLEQRKLLGLALTNILTTQSPPVLERFGLIMLNILETLNDITKTEENDVLVDSLVLIEGQSPSHFEEDPNIYYVTDHGQRIQQLILSDPVHTIVLKDYLQSQIYELRNQIGVQHYQQLLLTMDADTAQQLSDYITF